MKFLDPTNDVAFKKIFGNDQKKEVLISLLNSLLGLKEGKKILEVEIQNPYLVPRIADLKNTVLDVKCKDQRNISYLVEMQVAKA
ncbi:MAG TPA: transposase, partial [Spirochaetia bacterium]|nr:transposase [Spirochaetia bacterium]